MLKEIIAETAGAKAAESADPAICPAGGRGDCHRSHGTVIEFG